VAGCGTRSARCRFGELPNNPRLLTGGISELADVIDVQDRINKTIADRLITQDFGAFPQKWATGYPEEDSQGNSVAPIDIGRDRIVTTDIAETKFGQWDRGSDGPVLGGEARGREGHRVPDAHPGAVPAGRDVERQRRDAEGVGVGSGGEGSSADAVVLGGLRGHDAPGAEGGGLPTGCAHGDDVAQPGVPHRG
jgi:hypothetical protein